MRAECEGGTAAWLARTLAAQRVQGHRLPPPQELWPYESVFFFFFFEPFVAGNQKASLASLPAAAAKSLRSYPTLCDPIKGSPPGAAVPGILQARTLEWVAISFSNA